MTARKLYIQCRRTGIILRCRGDQLSVKPPPGVAVPMDGLRQCKAELMPLLAGNYGAAALELLWREVPAARRMVWAKTFNQRQEEARQRGLRNGEAVKAAYIAMATAIEAGGKL